jgi:hypothetical protein
LGAIFLVDNVFDIVSPPGLVGHGFGECINHGLGPIFVFQDKQSLDLFSDWLPGVQQAAEIIDGDGSQRHKSRYLAVMP